MGKRKNLSNFDKAIIVMTRWRGQSISKTAAVVGSFLCLQSVYQKWSKEGKAVNRRQGHGWPRFIDADGLPRVVPSGWAAVAQIAERVNAGSDRKVSEHSALQFVAINE